MFAVHSFCIVASALHHVAEEFHGKRLCLNILTFNNNLMVLVIKSRAAFKSAAASSLVVSRSVLRHLGKSEHKASLSLTMTDDTAFEHFL